MEVKSFIKNQIIEIKRQVENKRTISACSGGVDSTVCTILAHKALGKNLIAVFIDDGLMREGETEKVTRLLKNFKVRTKLVRVPERFFKALKGITDPENKRKAFRETFYRVLGEIIKKQKAKFLIQGTIKADIVETTGGVKTQHNVLQQIGIDPQKYGFKVIEPLKDLFKPEVREVAQSLGLHKEIWDRMAFPGPGLATRIIGEVTSERVMIIRKATEIVEKEITRVKYPKMYQAFPVLFHDKGTGVVEGKRAFGEIIVIRSIDSQNAITGTATKLPWKVLDKLQRSITKEISSVVRVLYELTPKPPATIEYI